jgi:thiol-disulfide isomerase/thioredoxin
MIKQLFAALTLALMAACSGAANIDEAAKNAPQAQGKLLDGKPFDIAEAKGQVTVVQFWATWCPVCVKEMPMVQQWYDAQKGRGLRMVAVSIDDSTKEVTDWLAKNPYTLPFAWHKDVRHNFGRIKGTPTFVVIGKDGKVAATYVGGITPAQLDDIAKLI